MRILLAGSSGGIGAALTEHLREQGHEVFTISRSGEASTEHCVADLSRESSIKGVAEFAANVAPEAVVCCAGVLHQEGKMPEKSLTQMTDDWLLTNLQRNLLPHVHLARAVAPLVKRSAPVKWMSLSAMVGSLEDNGLGGWYSYRMSKAALNMFIRNLSIEWGRRAPGSVVVAQHPGTTESELSEPFQAGIAEGKLYTREQTAERLATVLEGLSPEQHGRLLHWDGSIIPF